MGSLLRGSHFLQQFVELQNANEGCENLRINEENSFVSSYNHVVVF